jgi:sn-glycerol 3-phosphate transport system substrate-binding protein
MTAGIAAFRAGEQPHIIQVFDAGAATIINAPGAVIPVEDLLTEHGGLGFDIDDYIEGVRYFYADSDGKMIGMPFNSSTPLCTSTKTRSRSRCRAARDLGRVRGHRAEAEVEAGYIPLAQSHSPWISPRTSIRATTSNFATDNNGFDSADVEILVQQRRHARPTGHQGEGMARRRLLRLLRPRLGRQPDAFVQRRSRDVARLLGLVRRPEERGRFRLRRDLPALLEAITDEPTATFIGGAALFSDVGQVG